MPRVEWAPLSVTPSSWLSWRYSPGHWRPLPRPHWDGYHSRSPPSITTEVTARAQTARSCLGLVLTRRAWLPLGHMQGGSHCLSHAVERERARWPQRVLGRGHGLEGREPWRSRVAFYDVALTLVLYSACGVDLFVQ